MPLIKKPKGIFTQAELENAAKVMASSLAKSVPEEEEITYIIHDFIENKTWKPVVIAKHDKVAHEWYLEDSWPSGALFRDVEFPQKKIVDPFAGIGRIMKAAQAVGYQVNGCDVVKREKCGDFYIDIADSMEPLDGDGDLFLGYQNYHIVTNPPYGLVGTLLHRLAKDKLAHRAAFFMPLTYMAGKAKLLDNTPLSYVLVCSPRPNCLPGELKLKTEIKGSPEQKKNGSGLKDYAWFVFDPGYKGRPQVDWLYKKSTGNKVIFAVDTLAETVPQKIEPEDNPAVVLKDIIENMGLKVDEITFASMEKYINAPAPVDTKQKPNE